VLKKSSLVKIAGAAVLTAAALATAVTAATPPAGGPRFAISFPAAQSATPLDGRVVLLLSTNTKEEPRLQVSPDAALRAPYMFGMNVTGLKPGATAVLDNGAFGWPARNLSSVKAGDYVLQVVLNRYETFRRSDGVVISLPPDKGEGQQWALKPGNLYSKPVKVHFDPAHPGEIKVVLDQKIAPIAPPKDTPYVRHVMIRSAALSKFWGRDVFIGAHVLLPEGFDKHPNAHYPLMVFHGHFPSDISEFRPTPPDANLKPDYSERFHLAGYNRIQQQEDYASYKRWTSPNFPRFIVIEIEHANPYYDDSYAVNSANLGPYGDAINKELIPYIEKKYRGIGQGWARFTYGGSTGGWEAMATQVFYPDMYNGAFAACPDPIDFRAFTIVNLYQDKNAYVSQGQALTVERPGMRNYLGETLATQRDSNYMELVLGDRGRSGQQYDIWQAVYSPRGADGYPAPIWNKVTGQIDPKVAAYWRDHYDLTYIVQRDWKTLGPKLAGKLHIYVGRGDNYFLTDAVYLAEPVLKGLKNPVWGGEIDYGAKDEHCWNGDHNTPNAWSRLHYNHFYLPKIMARIKASAPKGADLASWQY
jgi:hypothetical protein